MHTSKKHNHTQGMDKRRIKIISRVLDAVKLNVPETTQVIEECQKQERSEKNISVDKVIFLFTSLEAKYFLFSSAKT